MLRLRHHLCLLALAPIAACGGQGGASIPKDDPPEGSTAQADTIQCPVPPPTTCQDYNALKNAYFGDLHSHTSFSLDAYGFGTRAGPANAYAFASNPNGTENPQDEIAIASGAAGSNQTPGPTVTIDRPLDFLAVTDHSEFFNVDYGCTVDSGSGYYSSSYCATLRNAGSATQASEIAATLSLLALQHPVEPGVCQGGSLLGGSPAQCSAEELNAWQAEQQATACAYDPCTFTSLYAYEWTATTNTDNLHRNVIFGSAQVPTMPFDYIDYPTPHALWNALSTQCTGACSAITIPHNSNLSGGQMFAPPTSVQDLAYMTEYQRLAEIHQHRGNSECFYDPASGGPGTNGGSSDPNCAFETLPGTDNATDAPGYVRNALECGLTYYAGETGSQCVGGAGVAAAGEGNPFQLGVVGATDTHNATPGNTVESPRLATPGSNVPVDFPGHFGVDDDEPILRVQGCAQGDSSCTGTTNINQGYNPGGLTGVWVQQNTRDRIFAALQRREVFGTSGTRIKVRFYAYTGSQSPCADPSFPQQVVASGGVPMGGTIGSVPAGGLSFVVYAMPETTPLAEVDIIKASVINGVIQEQIMDNVQFGQETQGAICATWNDSTYVPTAPAFYYARVLEQPLPPAPPREVAGAVQRLAGARIAALQDRVRAALDAADLAEATPPEPAATDLPTRRDTPAHRAPRRGRRPMFAGALALAAAGLVGVAFGLSRTRSPDAGAAPASPSLQAGTRASAAPPPAEPSAPVARPPAPPERAVPEAPASARRPRPDARPRDPPAAPPELHANPYARSP